MTSFAEDLIRKAREEAATPEGRARVVAALRRTLAEVSPPTPCTCDLVDDRTANALDGLAAALSMAADHAACVADRARIIAPPRRLPRRPAQP